MIEAYEELGMADLADDTRRVLRPKLSELARRLRHYSGNAYFDVIG